MLRREDWLRRAGVAALALVLPAAAARETASGPATGTSASPRRPGLLLITAEGLRSDRLSCYGRVGAARTPNLDRLAADGRLFENVLAPSPSSVSSLATLMTGQYPFRHHVWDDTFRNRLPEGAVTLAEQFKKAGYRTAAFVATSRLAAGRGLDQGFDLYQDGYRPPPTGVWTLIQRTADSIVPAARSWLEGVAADPFFLWVHFIDPVIPGKATMTQPAAGAPATYIERVEELEARVGELLQSLKDRGLYGNTTIVLTAASGLDLGDHGEGRAGVFLYDSTIRVPLILKTAARPPEKERRVGGLAGLVDLSPTLQRLFGLAPAPGAQGRDLLASPETAPRSYYAAALMGRDVFGWSPLELVASGSWRLITGGEEELFDVATDPGQKKNLAMARPAEVQRLRNLRGQVTSGAQLPPPRFLPNATVPVHLSRRLVEMGFVAPQPEMARKRPLPDPRRYLAALPLLEDMHLRVELAGPVAIGEVERQLLEKVPDSLFTLLTAAGLIVQTDDKGEQSSRLARILADAQRLYLMEPEVYHLLGHAAFPPRRYADAELFLTVTQSLGPRFPGEVAYDLACAYSRQGKVRQALSELRTGIRLGFRHVAHISADPDLEAVRKDPGYPILMQEEFPENAGR